MASVALVIPVGENENCRLLFGSSEEYVLMTDMRSLYACRLERWRQTPQTRIPDADTGMELIHQLGLVTLYPASPELPDLYHAYVGDPNAKTDSKWDSPSGQVFGWRWTLGRKDAGFYCALVRGRTTWVSWELLPAVLRLCGELRMPDELYDARVISPEAYRVARALDEAGGTLTTSELRSQAGFANGKEQRKAYLKAVEELDSRLLLAKVLYPDSDDMGHALVFERYRQHMQAADRMTREDALRQFLLAYLPHAVYALPAPLARHLKLPEAELRAGLDQLVAEQRAECLTLPEVKGACYVWRT